MRLTAPNFRISLEPAEEAAPRPIRSSPGAAPGIDSTPPEPILTLLSGQGLLLLLLLLLA